MPVKVMRETCEFRVLEEFASKLFFPNEGKRLGTSVRQIDIATDDPRFIAVGQLQSEIEKTTDKAFFYGWILRHHYTKEELKRASLLYLKVMSTFEPAGEECGTRYDEAAACPKCGAGAPQTTPLCLPEKRIPKSKDISRTIAGEIVVSRRVKDLFARHQVRGAQLNPIRHSQNSSAESSDWFQLILVNTKAEIVSPARVGIDPFDEDRKGEFRCPNGDTIGLNLLSEISVKTSTIPKSDIMGTQQFLGCRGGLIRPERQILISQRLYRLFESEKIRGYKVEVANMVSGVRETTNS